MLPCTNSLDFFFCELKSSYRLGHLMKVQSLLTEYNITFKGFATIMTQDAILSLSKKRSNYVY